MFTNEFITSNDFLKTYQWRSLRQKVIRNNQKRCSCCGIAPDKNNSIYLCVDHILPRKTHPELALSIDNLQVLCNECNHGKGNKDSTDWRSKADFIINKDWLAKHTNNFAGLKKAQLAVLNLHWPPVSGWVDSFIGMTITEEQKILFEVNMNNKAKYSGIQKNNKKIVNVNTK